MYGTFQYTISNPLNIFPKFICSKVPGDSLLESISSCESTVFDAVTLRVAQKRAYLSPLKSATNTILSNQSSKNVNSSSPNSSIEHLAKVFCFDNIFSEDGCDYSSEDSKVSPVSLFKKGKIICTLMP